MSLPVVSVVMSCYNSEKYVGDAIDSIVQQSYSNLEFLIVDDGSSDETLNIIQSYDDKRIKVITRENRGLIYSRNQAIESSTGSYIAIMDADDISRSDRLAKQVEFMEKNLHISACGGAISQFNETGSIKTVQKPTEHSDLVYYSLHRTPISHPAAMIRKSILDEHNLSYNRHYPCSMDCKLWFDILQVGQLANLTDTLTDYRISQNQISTSRRTEQKKLAEQARAEGYLFIKNNLKPESKLQWYYLLKYIAKFDKDDKAFAKISKIFASPILFKQKIELSFYSLI